MLSLNNYRLITTHRSHRDSPSHRSPRRHSPSQPARRQDRKSSQDRYRDRDRSRHRDRPGRQKGLGDRDRGRDRDRSTDREGQRRKGRASDRDRDRKQSGKESERGGGDPGGRSSRRGKNSSPKRDVDGRGGDKRSAVHGREQKRHREGVSRAAVRGREVEAGGKSREGARSSYGQEREREERGALKRSEDRHTFRDQARDVDIYGRAPPPSQSTRRRSPSPPTHDRIVSPASPKASLGRRKDEERSPAVAPSAPVPDQATHRPPQILSAPPPQQPQNPPLFEAPLPPSDAGDRRPPSSSPPPPLPPTSYSPIVFPAVPEVSMGGIPAPLPPLPPTPPLPPKHCVTPGKALMLSQRIGARLTSLASLYHMPDPTTAPTPPVGVDNWKERPAMQLVLEMHGYLLARFDKEYVEDDVDDVTAWSLGSILNRADSQGNLEEEVGGSKDCIEITSEMRHMPWTPAGRAPPDPRPYAKVVASRGPGGGVSPPHPEPLALPAFVGEAAFRHLEQVQEKEQERSAWLALHEGQTTPEGSALQQGGEQAGNMHALAGCSPAVAALMTEDVASWVSDWTPEMFSEWTVPGLGGSDGTAVKQHSLQELRMMASAGHISWNTSLFCSTRKLWLPLRKAPIAPQDLIWGGAKEGALPTKAETSTMAEQRNIGGKGESIDALLRKKVALETNHAASMSEKEVDAWYNKSASLSRRGSASSQGVKLVEMAAAPAVSADDVGRIFKAAMAKLEKSRNGMSGSSTLKTSPSPAAAASAQFPAMPGWRVEGAELDTWFASAAGGGLGWMKIRALVSDSGTPGQKKLHLDGGLPSDAGPLDTKQKDGGQSQVSGRGADDKSGDTGGASGPKDEGSTPPCPAPVQHVAKLNHHLYEALKQRELRHLVKTLLREGLEVWDSRHKPPSAPAPPADSNLPEGGGTSPPKAQQAPLKGPQKDPSSGGKGPMTGEGHAQDRQQPASTQNRSATEPAAPSISPFAALAGNSIKEEGEVDEEVKDVSKATLQGDKHEATRDGGSDRHLSSSSRDRDGEHERPSTQHLPSSSRQKEGDRDEGAGRNRPSSSRPKEEERDEGAGLNLPSSSRPKEWERDETAGRHLPSRSRQKGGERDEAAGRQVPSSSRQKVGERGEAAGRQLPSSSQQKGGERDEAAGRQLPSSSQQKGGERDEAAGRQLPSCSRPRDGDREDTPGNHLPSSSRHMELDREGKGATKEAAPASAVGLASNTPTPPRESAVGLASKIATHPSARAGGLASRAVTPPPASAGGLATKTALAPGENGDSDRLAAGQERGRGNGLPGQPCRNSPCRESDSGDEELTTLSRPRKVTKKANSGSKPSSAHASMMMKALLSVLKELEAFDKEECDELFRDPVDFAEYPLYPQKIRKPMDLKMLKKNVTQKVYPPNMEGFKMFKADTELLGKNCLQFNPDIEEYVEWGNSMLAKARDCCTRKLEEVREALALEK
eukprot:gene11814-37_t